MILSVLFIIAAMRRASTAVEKRPDRILSFNTPASPSEVAKSIIRFAQSSGYAIEEISPNEDRIIVSEPPTLTTWGFFYPIYTTRQPDNSTLVEIGAKSKLVQYGPLVDRSHEKFVNGIKAILYSEGFGSDNWRSQNKTVDGVESQPTMSKDFSAQRQHYCPRCGSRAKMGDRFCAACGHGLALG